MEVVRYRNLWRGKETAPGKLEGTLPMAGLATAASTLREVHRLRRHAKELQDEIERAPRILKARQAKITAEENALKEGQDELKRLKVSALDKESQLKGLQQNIAKHEKQKNEATAKKEYDALGVEIASDKKKCLDLEDVILEALTKTDEQTARIPALEAAVQKARQEFVKFEKETQARAEGLKQELAKAKQQIQAVEDTLPTEQSVRGLYNRIISSMKDDALAGVANRTCTACYTEMTAQNLHDLKQGNFVMCKSCGRALYMLD
jgi:predicted  nucleic acid-binding Zn-ribbon protein